MATSMRKAGKVIDMMQKIFLILDAGHFLVLIVLVSGVGSSTAPVIQAKYPHRPMGIKLNAVRHEENYWLNL